MLCEPRDLTVSGRDVESGGFPCWRTKVSSTGVIRFLVS